MVCKVSNASPETANVISVDKKLNAKPLIDWFTDWFCLYILQCYFAVKLKKKSVNVLEK